MPNSFFEVEYSTDIQSSLVKFTKLQDFYADFYIVSDKNRENEFQRKIGQTAFKDKDIRNMVRFIDYNFISNLHAKLFELSTIGDL